MKKRMSKLMSLLLAGTMVFSLAACGGTEGDGTAATSDSAAAQTEAPAGETAAEQTESGTADAERPKITVAVYNRDNVPASEGTIVDNRWTRWIQENAPVDVEFIAIPRWESGEKYNALFASGTAPDLIEEFGVDNMNTFYSNGLLMPLNDLIEEHSVEYKALLEEYPALESFLTKEDGQMYTFGVVNKASSNHYLIVRKDWMENLGLEDPVTTEDFVELCMAFTFDDPDGNGQDDTQALSFAGVMNSLIHAMYGGMGTWQDDWYLEDPTDETSDVVYHWDWAEDAVAMMEELYEAGCVSPDYATDSNGSMAQQDFINGKTGIFGLNGGKGAILSLLTNVTANNPDADLKAIPLPISENGAFQPAGGGFLQSNAAINADCENPEAVMAYIDWLNKPETIMMLKYGGDEYSEIDEATGAYVPKDQEVFQTEVSYNGDMYMTSSGILDPYSDILKFDESDPLQKRAKEIVIEADGYYLDPSRTFYQLKTKPSLPSDLALIQANIGTQIDDAYTKAILDSSYTVEQAVADAQKVFTDAGGDQITEYLNEWYDNNDGFISSDEVAPMLPSYLQQAE